MKVNTNTIYSLALLSFLLLCQIPTTLARDEGSSQGDVEKEELLPLIGCFRSFYSELKSDEIKQLVDHQNFILDIGKEILASNENSSNIRRLNNEPIDNDPEKERTI